MIISKQVLCHLPLIFLTSDVSEYFKIKGKKVRIWLDRFDFVGEFMNYVIRMGIPEMKKLWNHLQTEHRSGTIKKKDEQLYKKLGNALNKLSQDPFYPSLRTHEISQLTKRYGLRVWQSYLENKTSGAMRIYWAYGPGKQEITVLGLEPHPEDKKNGAYDRIILSDMDK